MMYEVVLTRNDTGTGKPTLRYFIVNTSERTDAVACAINAVEFAQWSFWRESSVRALGEHAVEVLGQVELI